MTNPHPEATQEPTKHHLIRTKDSPITKEIARDLGTVCKMFLLCLSLKKLQGFQELSPNIYFLLYHISVTDFLAI